MSLFEADLNALQHLISVLDTVENELDSLYISLDSAFNNFASSFVSPDKGNLESNYNELRTNYLLNALNKTAEIESGLQTLQTYIQDAESVHF